MNLLYCVWDAEKGYVSSDILKDNAHGEIIAFVVNSEDCQYWYIGVDKTAKLNRLSDIKIYHIPPVLLKQDTDSHWHVFVSYEKAMKKSQELLHHKKELADSERNGIYNLIEAIELINEYRKLIF